jgi:hypothetical protein
MDATPSRIFIMIDNTFSIVYVAVYNNDEILCLLPLLGFIVRYTGKCLHIRTFHSLQADSRLLNMLYRVS